MHVLNLTKSLLVAIAAAVLLAACASNPAPVSNYSFGGSNPPPATTAAAPPATAGKGVQTYGLGSHASGTVSNGGYKVAPGDTLYSIAFAHGIDFRTLAAQNGIAAPYVIHPGQVLKLQPGAATAVVAPQPVATTPAPVAPAPPPTTPAPAAVPQPQPAPPSGPVFGPVTSQAMTATGVAPAESASTAPAVAATTAPATAASAPPAGTPPQAALAPEVAVPTPPPGATRSVGGITWQWPASGKVVGGFQSGSGGDGAGLNIAGNMGDPVRAAASGTVVYSGNGLIGYGELIIIKHNDTYLSAYGHNSKRLVKEGDRISAGQEIALMGASGSPRVELHFEIRKDGKPVDPLGYLPAK
ncbi:MAG TPA: peptidoglycan DD-metalloendopeptidase family protein [Rhodanobacteraceae bacterium]|nr:peptidoglycan DD-metalloendopeptidase family protein [Rhodanobacteraceae bacterium]